jgi:hypothetical protein
MITITLHEAHYDAYMEEMYEQSQERMCGCYDKPKAEAEEEAEAIFNEHQQLRILTGRSPMSYAYRR